MAVVINGFDMRMIRFSLCQLIRRAFRLGFSATTLIAAHLVLFASQAHALGLGNMTVNSYLDEPLDLRVELILDPGVDNLEQVEFDLASRKEFSIAGISRPDFMDEIQFEILSENGKNWLRISSDSQMREPFLHILLRAEWEGGSLLREYTALIDPPAYSSRTPTPVMAPRVTDDYSSISNSISDANAVVQNTATSEAFPANQGSYVETDSTPLVPETPAYNQTPAGQPVSVDEAFGVYGPIEEGETLSGIAAQLQQVYPELGYYQTLYVLHRDNQDAFIDGNMNLLKKGEILRVDSLEDIRNVSREVAVQVFQEQQGEWQSYLADRGKVAPTYVASDSPANAAQGNINEASSRSSANESASTQDQFRIGSAEGAGQSSSGAGNDARALQSEISELESSLLSSQLENSELRERLELLEIQLDEVNQLIALEDPTLAALQQGLGNSSSASSASAGQDLTLNTQPTEPITASSSENNTPPSLVGVGTAISDSTPNPSNPNDSGSGIINSGQALVDQSGIGTENLDGPPTPLLIVDEQSWIDRALDYMPEIDFQNTTTLGIIGAAIAALCALLFLRRRRAQEEFEHSMLSMAVEGAHSQFDTESMHDVDLEEDEAGGADADAVHRKDSSFLTVYNDDAASVHSDDVDPLAEAEVYLAYGRENQAIEVLKEGLNRSAERFDIRVKLLEIYHKLENKAEFESLAEQFYADKTVTEDKLWRKVAKLARGLELTNPIFSGTGDAMERLSSLLEVDSSDSSELVENLSEQVSKLDAVDIEQSSVSSDDAIGLDVSSNIEASSSLEIAADLSAVTLASDLDFDDSQKSVAASKPDIKESSKFSDVVIEVESVIEEMSSVDILDLEDTDLGSTSMLDSGSIDSLSQDMSGYGDKVAADIETAASYLDSEDDFTRSESARTSGAAPTRKTAGNDSLLEFDTQTVGSGHSVSDSIDLASGMEGSSIDLGEPLSFSEAGSGEQVSTSELLDISTIDLPSESLPSVSDSEFNVDLTASIEQYFEALTPDANAIGELSELSDLMLSENTSEAGSSQALDEEDIQTQLDLAKVYVELGDAEGADQILKDVMEYGNTEQKKKASEILSELKA